MKNIFKKFAEWLTIGQPMQEHICSDCGEEYIYSPGLIHKCDQKKLIHKTVLEMKEKGII